MALSCFQSPSSCFHLSPEVHDGFSARSIIAGMRKCSLSVHQSMFFEETPSHVPESFTVEGPALPAKRFWKRDKAILMVTPEVREESSD